MCILFYFVFNLSLFVFFHALHLLFDRHSALKHGLAHIHKYTSARTHTHTHTHTCTHTYTFTYTYTCTHTHTHTHTQANH